MHKLMKVKREAADKNRLTVTQIAKGAKTSRALSYAGNVPNFIPSLRFPLPA